MSSETAVAPHEIAALVMAQSARAVAAVAFEGRSADDALAHLPPAQAAAIRAVSLGTLRWWLRLDAVSAALLGRRALSPPLRALLGVALHQLEYSRNPPPTVVSAAVDATRRLQQPRAAAMMNALLRRFGRERPALLGPVDADPARAAAHPVWLVQALRSAWPEHWQTVLEANNAHPPLTLRLDRTRTSRQDYLLQLQQVGLAALPFDWLDGALQLATPVGVNALPGFVAGLCSVQDAGAQLAAALLQVRPGERVLDACAAPGGKTGALLEAVDGALSLTALDVDGARVQRIADNLKRLRRTAELVTADLAADEGWDGLPYDRILLDAPCSGTGVIRRHPDIKLLRRPTDIAALAEQQQRLLRVALGRLKPGGRLLYTTCSVLPAENDAVVAAVLQAEPQVRSIPLPEDAPRPPQWLAQAHGHQLLPGGEARTDGFYYACLTVT